MGLVSSFVFKAHGCFELSEGEKMSPTQTFFFVTALAVLGLAWFCGDLYAQATVPATVAASAVGFGAALLQTGRV
jgi:hypothetical protein